MNIGVIILTYNEERHIGRCLSSVKSITDKVFVVDSYSGDKTIEIASMYGAVVKQNRFINHANQVNWGIDNYPFDTEWIMRIDADEYLTKELQDEINEKLDRIRKEVSGVYLKRRVYHMNKWIKHGGYYPTWLLRIWRNGKAVCEERWMDEHIKLIEGDAIEFDHDIIDDNLHSLTVWTTKHNNYATREAIELLNLSGRFFESDQVVARLMGTQEQRKRWLKKRYAKLPLFVRPMIYFLYRYFFKFGFLDGKEGLVWHVLQGFWYRFLVDAKVMELQKVMKAQGCDARTAIRTVHSIEL